MTDDPNELDPNALRELAIKGIRAEIDRLNEALRALDVAAHATLEELGDSEPRKVKRIVSRAQREAASRRMKAYWATRKSQSTKTR